MHYQSWVLGVTMCLLCIGLGCSQRESDNPSPEIPKQVTVSESKLAEKQPNTYQPSSVESEFPVPKQAQKTDHQSKKTNTKYVRYLFRGLTDVKLRKLYFAEIEKWGWVEQKEKQIGSMHLFTKGDKRIQMAIHQEFFTLFY